MNSESPISFGKIPRIQLRNQDALIYLKGLSQVC